MVRSYHPDFSIFSKHLRNTTMKTKYVLTFGVIIALAMVITLLPDLAHAAGEWAEQGKKAVDTLKDGTITIGQGIAMAGLVGVGIFIVASGNINIKMILAMVVGAILIIAGPSMIDLFMTEVKG
jgi:hypothetical protein